MSHELTRCHDHSSNLPRTHCRPVNISRTHLFSRTLIEYLTNALLLIVGSLSISLLLIIRNESLTNSLIITNKHPQTHCCRLPLIESPTNPMSGLHLYPSRSLLLIIRQHVVNPMNVPRTHSLSRTIIESPTNSCRNLHPSRNLLLIIRQRVMNALPRTRAQYLATPRQEFPILR